MRFSKFIKDNWPPIIEGKLVCSPLNNRMSNYFTQYIKYLLKKYTNVNKNYFFLEEVACKNPRHKLDYLVIKGKEEEYLKGRIIPPKCKWVAAIETQWGNTNKTKLNDFLYQDFPKLVEYESSFRYQVKVAIMDVGYFTSESWRENHDKVIEELKKFAKKDRKSRYLIILTTVSKKNKYIHMSIYDKWESEIRNSLKYT